MYEFLTWVTGAVALGATWFAYRKSRDTFHPLVFLGPMLAYSYSFIPLLLINSGVIWNWLPQDDMVFVQAYYLMGVLAMTFGVLSARPPSSAKSNVWDPHPAIKRQIRFGGLFLGVIGIAAFFDLVSNVGGLDAAYGDAHSEGWSDSGYVREAFYLIVPALMLLLVGRSGRRLRAGEAMSIAIVATPMLFHAIFSAYRGPTFMIIITLLVGWYFPQNRRPSLQTMIITLGATGFLLLFLVVNRNALYLGGNFDFQSPEAAIGFVDRNSPGNEYILGSGVVINSFDLSDYGWGTRYFIETVIRAIPRGIWPTKYEDVSAFLGIFGINMSTLGDLTATLGWKSPNGGSMGLLADMWEQLSFFGLVLAFGIGRFYGMAWRRAVNEGGLWLIVYGLALVLSLYLTQQTLQSALYRLLFFSGGCVIVWQLFVRPTAQRLRQEARIANVRALRRQASST